MLTKMKRRTLTVSLTSTLMLVSTGSFGAVTVLKNCFGAPQTYSIDYHHEFTSTENVANNDYDIPGHLVGAGADLEANCTCPGNMFSSSTVYEKTLAGSPLNPGTSGTGYLTDKIDAHITGYADAINSPDGSSLTPIPINEYPTPREICLPCSNRACLKQKKKATYAAMTPGLTVVPHRNASFAGTSWPCCCT